MDTVKIAIVGVDRYTDQLLACLRKSDRLCLSGVCETQPALLSHCRNTYEDIPFFDDPREMILREKPNVVLLWRDCCENNFLDAVIGEGVWLVLRSPITGGLSTATRLIKQAEKNNVGVFVWTPWLFMPCYESAHDWLTDQQIRSFLCRSFNNLPRLEMPVEDALLPACMYPYFFLAHRWLGLPEQVYCRELSVSISNGSAENSLQYFGLTNLLYPQAIGTISAGVNAGPFEDEVIVTGNTHQIHVLPEQAKLFDCDGKPIESSQLYEPDQIRQIAYVRLFEQIWQSYVEQRRSNDIELKRHLGTLAILEAAALSARTGHPEQLNRIVELNNITAMV
jgi:hypothetical protein